MTQAPPEAGTQPFITTPDDAEHIRPFGLNIYIAADMERTGGRLSALVAEHRPEEGPPHHVHFQQEEMFFVIEGLYEVTVGDVTRTAGAGAFVYIPRNTVHTFRNIGPTVARMLDLTVPGGQERYFREIDALAKGDGFSGDRVQEISLRYDTHFPHAH